MCVEIAPRRAVSALLESHFTWKKKVENNADLEMIPFSSKKHSFHSLVEPVLEFVPFFRGESFLPQPKRLSFLF